MVMIALCSSIFGVVLGTRFRVQVLLPAVMLGFGIVAIVASLKGWSLSLAITAVILSLISLQIGYLGGLFTRFFMPAGQATSRRSLRSTIVRS